MRGAGGNPGPYRDQADDLKLGAPVALKFLPQAARHHQALLERQLAEVRIARQISHPNICRVYDASEIDGQQFLSMEYIDGEDLASLLRRIGRLPREKALQIARQLCAGLAAAHEKDYLHRDLKPANIMIDGRGRARITDFGLAALADEVSGRDVRSGTPAYMAPEQLAGEEVTKRSDIYSLGLVLYELFTGRRAFAEESAGQRLETPLSSDDVTRPSSHVEGIDRAVESVILRCLENDPGQRPASALAVAAAIPGGDPLAAAVAAGETPSPELVAQAGSAGSLGPGVAWSLLVVLIAGLGLNAWLGERTQLFNTVGWPKPPAVLEERCREIARGLGYSQQAMDSQAGTTVNFPLVSWLNEKKIDEKKADLENVGKPAVSFWYRESPSYLERLNAFGLLGSSTFQDPPISLEGMTWVSIDPSDGRLLHFVAVPPEIQPQDQPRAQPDVASTNWAAVLEMAGLDPAALRSVEPGWSPKHYADELRAWEPVVVEQGRVPLRVEAASHRGRVVSFRLVGPFDQRVRFTGSEQVAKAGLLSGYAYLSGLAVAAVLGLLVVAMRNLRSGRGDRRGATRLSLFLWLGSFSAWILGAHHVATPLEFLYLGGGLGAACLSAGIGFVGYLAIEPYMRRLWPDLLVSWSRLIEGRWRDPLVGRHILLGSLVGVTYALIVRLGNAAGTLVGVQSYLNWSEFSVNVLSLHHVVASVLRSVTFSTASGMILVGLLPVLHLLVRKRWLAAAAFVATLLAYLAAGLTTLSVWEAGWQIAAVAALALPLVVLVLFRGGGLLPLLVANIASNLLLSFPLTADPSAWYFGVSTLILGVPLALGIYGFSVATVGRPILGGELAVR